MDDFDLAFAPDEPASNDNGQAPDTGGTPDQSGEVQSGTDAIDHALEAEAKGDTTANAGTEAKAPAGESKGVIPKELEPYKGILESRKWDPTKPDFAPNVLKSYQEVEAYAKRAETQSKLLQSKTEQVAAKLRADVDTINAYRKSQGLPPIKAERPVEDRHKEFSSLLDNLNKVLSNPNDTEAYRALDSYLSKQRDDLEFERRMASQNQAPSADAAFEQRQVNASRVYSNFIAKSPEAAVHIDALGPLVQPGGLLDSFGLDVLDLSSTPERLAAFAEIGEALNIKQNLEKIVEERVKSELERRRSASVTTGSGKQPQQGQKQANQDLSPVDMAFL